MNQFKVSLTTWAKSQESVHKPQFLKRKESRSGSNRGPSAYQPSASPQGHTGSRRLRWLQAGLYIQTSEQRVRYDCQHDKGKGAIDDVNNSFDNGSRTVTELLCAPTPSPTPTPVRCGVAQLARSWGDTLARVGGQYCPYL